MDKKAIEKVQEAFYDATTIYLKELQTFLNTFSPMPDDLEELRLRRMENSMSKYLDANKRFYKPNKG